MPRASTAQVVLDAAYRCFCRNGYRRTTMSDIVEEAQLSRPTVYKYVGTKDDAIAKIVQLRLEQALAAAQAAAFSSRTPEAKVLAVLTVKLEVAIRLWHDSPAHGQELLAAATAQAPELVTNYTNGMAAMLTSSLEDVIPEGAQQAATILLTFTRGLEDELRDVDAVLRELRAGVEMITRGAIIRPVSSPV